jgi:hypothetical protein
MSNARSKLVALALVGGGVLAAYSMVAGPGPDSEASGAEHLVNQVWLERLPEHERDMIGHVLVLDHPRARIGIAGRSSQWRHFIEGFKWALEGDRLSAVFPQEKARAQFRVKTWRCEGDAPHPFELCLRISRGDRSAVFYSREDWVVEPHDAARSLSELVADNPELSGLAAEFSDHSVDRLAELEDDGSSEAEAGWLPGL